MLSPTIEALLILQDRDTRRLGLEAQLKAVPFDVARVEQTIAAEKAALEDSKTELRSLESRKKVLETEIGSAETTLAKYRTQQLSVKKNDEYQALGLQIETMQKSIGDLEGVELEVMYGIDEAKKKFAAADALMKRNIAGHEERIRTLRERGASVAAELTVAQAEAEAARPAVPEPARRVYDEMTPRGMPAVVRIIDGKCGGCHLKISSEAESAARGKGLPGELARCDQCARIVYWAS